jgi:hypothetical protein
MGPEEGGGGGGGGGPPVNERADEASLTIGIGGCVKRSGRRGGGLLRFGGRGGAGGILGSVLAGGRGGAFTPAFLAGTGGGGLEIPRFRPGREGGDDGDGEVV